MDAYKDHLIAGLNSEFLRSAKKIPKKSNYSRVVYFAMIPRCGSTYVKDFFRKTGHSLNCRLTIHGAISTSIWDGAIPAGLSSPVSFAVIRNPYDLLLSHFMFSSSGGKQKKYLGFFDISHVMTSGNRGDKKINSRLFKEFVYNFCDPEFKPDQFSPFRKWMNFCHFLPNGDSGVRYLIRQEFLNDGLLNLFEGVERKARKLNITAFNLPKIKNYLRKNKRLNATAGKSAYASWYDLEMIDWIENKFYRELKVFNYSFDGPLDNCSLLSASSVVYNPIEDVLIKPNINHGVVK